MHIANETSKLFTVDVYGFRRSIRVVIRADVEFTRKVKARIQHITSHFSTHAQLVSAGHDFDYDQLLSELNLAVRNFNARGSGFVFNVVTRFVIVITQFRPLSGSSYIPTPPSILKKQAIINVQNHDNRCFEYAILSCLYPPKSHPCEAYNYTKYKNTLNFDGIPFPCLLYTSDAADE